MKTSKILSETWERDGIVSFVYVIDEMTELLKALCEYTEGRGSKEEIAREVADVLVTVGVLEYISPEVVEEKRQIVLKKLEKLLREAEENEKRREQK